MGSEDDLCVCHLDFANGTCPECGEAVDAYGNTEYQFENCSFPDCGCDGARLCWAGEASPNAVQSCVEGMWTGKTREQREAAFNLMKQVNDDKGRES